MKTIKPLLLIIAIGLFYSNIIAQNNLQFNASKYLKLFGTSVIGGFYTADSIVITVPNGKTWKIESASANASDGYMSTDMSNMYAVIALDGINIGASTWNNPGTSITRPFPIWLPAGTYTFSLVAYSQGTVKGFVSAIEFNLVN